MSDIRCTERNYDRIGGHQCTNMATKHFRSRQYEYIVISRCDKHMPDAHALDHGDYKDGWYEVTYESLVVAEVHQS
jgi:hypothetical protein